MKKILLTFLFLKTISSFSQENNSEFGFFMTLENLISNEKTNYKDIRIKESNLEYGDAFTKKYKTIYLLDITKKQNSEIGKIFGFTDGKDIYLGQNPPEYIMQANFGFTKAERIGHFLYFESITSDNMGITSTLQNVIDTKNKKIIIRLNNNKMKKILSEAPYLLKKFKKQKNKRKYYKDYLKEFIDR